MSVQILNQATFQAVLDSISNVDYYDVHDTGTAESGGDAPYEGVSTDDIEDDMTNNNAGSEDSGIHSSRANVKEHCRKYGRVLLWEAMAVAKQRR